MTRNNEAKIVKTPKGMQMIPPEPTPLTIKFECNCIYEAKHRHGDRRFECEHGRTWVITAHTPIEITYTIREVS